MERDIADTLYDRFQFLIGRLGTTRMERKYMREIYVSIPYR